MTRPVVWLLAASIAAALSLAGGMTLQSSASAHGGGLNRCGCHHDRRTGRCHCHRDRGCGCECQPSSCE
ncbi:MAG: hypothetical protein VYE22_15350 [Myxococcota bacterium]|nr:hypothetical protein [Myxococcota bacterium]